MKKLLLLSALFVLACSSDDTSNDNNNNASSLAGTWLLTSITNDAGELLDLEATCANQNYFSCNDNSGTAYFHFNENENGDVIDCYVSSTDTFIYTSTSAESNQYLFTNNSGIVYSGELISNGTVLSTVINEFVHKHTKQ